MKRTPVRLLTVVPCHVYWWSVVSHSKTRPYIVSGMIRPCAADTLRFGTIDWSFCACRRLGRNIRAPVRSSLGSSASVSVAAGRNAGAVAMSSMVEAVEKLRKTSLSNAESTDERLAETAAGSLKSTGDGASLPHATAVAKPNTTPARRSNRILPPKRNCGDEIEVCTRGDRRRCDLPHAMAG